MQVLSIDQLNNYLNEYQYFIIDRKVYELHFSNRLENKKVFFLDAPEENKCLEDFGLACDFFLENKIKRNDTIVCIGGGATTDLGGFVASSLFRGISWIAIPTTLLSMIDASIGGKVGINTKQGKNLIGHFHQPESELFVLELLETLDHNQMDSGRGELLKYSFLSEDIERKLERTSDYKSLIGDCVKFKKDVVAKDFKESGLRAILNYGHTFGHAFEKLTQVDHGIAVAIGIQLNIELFAKELQGHLNKLLSLLNLNLKHKKVSLEQFLDVLEFDKKNISFGLIRFVVVDPIGKTRFIDLKREELHSIIKESDVYDHYFI